MKGPAIKVLFLHGWHSVPGGVKPTFLAKYGHTVLNPALNDDDFDEAVRIVQAEHDQHRPDVIVGSSRGGAVAMNIDSGETPLVLLCPAWKRWGTATKIKRNSIICRPRSNFGHFRGDSQPVRRLRVVSDWLSQGTAMPAAWQRCSAAGCNSRS